ncbi:MULTISPECIES: hypothetical protein [unclassified Enterococcus]|uniref:hypothetical protein n=1 Tax=unclassified Enterococcus TaxID=2608891 RepID=UPI0013EA9EF0|nr:MULTISPECIES: hypothetical protein [unclassified Enterococcus]
MTTMTKEEKIAFLLSIMPRFNDLILRATENQLDLLMEEAKWKMDTHFINTPFS